MTIVGLISDTHGLLSTSAYEALADCDQVIHAGDIGGMHVITELETLAPVIAVLGNNDYPSEYPSRIGRFAHPEIEGVKFLVAHYPRDVKISFAGSTAVSPGDPIPDVCIHGHTHTPKLQWGKDAYPASFVLNPGSVSRPRSGSAPSIGKLKIENGKIVGVRIETVFGDEVMAVEERLS